MTMTKIAKGEDIMISVMVGALIMCIGMCAGFAMGYKKSTGKMPEIPIKLTMSDMLDHNMQGKDDEAKSFYD